MKNNKVRRIASFVCCVFCAIALVFLSFLEGCTREKITYRQTEYHEETAELEEYILGVMGDYICFDEPSIDESSGTTTIWILFLTDYINDENLMNEQSPISVMEETRLLLNDFVEENPSYFDNNKVFVSFAYQEYIDHGDGYGIISNYFLNTNDIEDSFCFADYEERLIVDDISGMVFDGVRETVLDDFENSDAVLDIIEHMPDIEKVYVDDDLIDELSEVRPDIEFL